VDKGCALEVKHGKDLVVGVPGAAARLRVGASHGSGWRKSGESRCAEVYPAAFNDGVLYGDFLRV
jgi:hypothetical protein